MIHQVENNQFFRRIYVDEEIIVGPTNGVETIANAGDLFSWIDPNFANWGFDKTNGRTLPTTTAVYELYRDAKFEEMFGSFWGESRSFCWKDQEQIIDFCCKHRDKLNTRGLSTSFFPFEVEGEKEPIVALVILNDDQLGVGVRRFKHSVIWRAESCHCLVVPQKIGN